MRSAKIITNMRCNQDCIYCHSHSISEAVEATPTADLKKQIDDARREPIQRIIFSGGEPTLRTDLEELIRHAQGVPSIAIETNATDVHEQQAKALKGAGLHLAVVNLARFGNELDQITQDWGGFDGTMSGVRALLNAGIEVEFSTPVIRANIDQLPTLPEQVSSALDDRPFSWTIGVPTDGPDFDQLVAFNEAAEAVTAFTTNAQAMGGNAILAPGTGMPPCVFPTGTLPLGLYALTRGGARHPRHQRIDACRECLVHDRCSGFDKAHVEGFGEPQFAPIKAEAERRRLSMISTTQAQIDRELTTTGRRWQSIDKSISQLIVRVQFECNQTCRFCFVSTHLPHPEHDRIMAAIDEGVRDGKQIVISGGEPTLHPRLLDYLRHAKTHSPHEVELQTNGVPLAEGYLAQRIVDAGAGSVYIALHGSNAQIADAVTGSPGDFDKTVVAITKLRRTGVKCSLSYVVCGQNATDFPDYVRFAADTWPDMPISLAYIVASTDVVPRDAATVPRYTDTLPAVAEGLRLADELGVRILGFVRMSGVPLCILPESIGDPFERRELENPDPGPNAIKVQECVSCALSSRCRGVLRGYVEVHGTSELKRVRQP